MKDLYAGLKEFFFILFVVMALLSVLLGAVSLIGIMGSGGITGPQHLPDWLHNHVYEAFVTFRWVFPLALAAGAISWTMRKLEKEEKD